jgi:hypothetical protein
MRPRIDRNELAQQRSERIGLGTHQSVGRVLAHTRDRRTVGIGRKSVGWFSPSITISFVGDARGVDSNGSGTGESADMPIQEFQIGGTRVLHVLACLAVETTSSS